MRAIVLANLDKRRPVVVLTREAATDYLANVTIAPITSTVRGISTEVPLGARNGLDHDCAASCDNILTVPKSALGETIGFLLDDQEPALAKAITSAFDLWV
jgi:mRNA interferase MazF